MAFIIRIPGITETINGNKLSLTVGGVRSYNLENLFDIVDDTLKLDESSPIMAIKENRAAIVQTALKLANGEVQRAADGLGLSRSTIWRLGKAI